MFSFVEHFYLIRIFRTIRMWGITGVLFNVLSASFLVDSNNFLQINYLTFDLIHLILIFLHVFFETLSLDINFLL